MPGLDVEFIAMMKRLQNQKTIKFATVDPEYTSGRPRVIFDGESTPTTKAYVYLSSYSPAANDRVAIIQNVIVGKLM